VLAGSLTYRITSVTRSPPSRISRAPCYRSAGHRLISLRTTSLGGVPEVSQFMRYMKPYFCFCDVLYFASDAVYVLHHVYYNVGRGVEYVLFNDIVKQ
jgi:hypothetical protein